MKSEVDRIYLELLKVLKKHSSKTNAVQMSAYMKNHFEFFGVKSVLRNELMKLVISKKNKPKKKAAENLVKLLWNDEHREFQYAGMEIWSWYNKEAEEKDISFIEKLIKTKPWWDTVDFIAAHLFGNYITLFPKKRDAICKKWSDSSNMWLQRSVILSQLKFKENTDSKFLFQYCKKHREDNEFFIRKAIGWALREYSKTNPKAVKSFVKSTNLSNLSVREATKYL
ncbi:MAG: DNA alkylation repair protein [Bacteroidia bacterium]|nr:DNA alkylation repair protein [Bacteroidia bacterium]